MSIVEDLGIIQETLPVQAVLHTVLPLAREHQLSAYDAAYLDLAIREGAVLATLDGAMRKAARKEGVPLAFTE
jgi:predicted nucleic acid-binding protein